jgi:glycerol-3-phosphate acyltransferase PlsY
LGAVTELVRSAEQPVSASDKLIRMLKRRGRAAVFMTVSLAQRGEKSIPQPATCHVRLAAPTLSAVPGLEYILIIGAAYLLGSIPTGYLVARAKGIDIRAVGSGNIGATNAFRVLGKPAGLFVLLADVLKGFTASFWLIPVLQAAGVGAQNDITERVVAGFAAILGHTFTCWLRFQGGKGIATSGGVYLAVAWPAAIVAVGSWLVVLFATRYVSLASIVASVALPSAVWATLGMHGSVPLGIATTALGAMVIWKHRSNMARLKAGTENRIDFGKQSTAGGKS